jgi:hypothetical protein
MAYRKAVDGTLKPGHNISTLDIVPGTNINVVYPVGVTGSLTQPS